MYWDDLKNGFEEVEKIRRLGQTNLIYFAEECRRKLYEHLDEEGVILLEQLICSIEFLVNKSPFEDNS